MHPRFITPDPTAPGEESVWDYPRPPRLERVLARVVVEFGGRIVVDTEAAWRVLETSHPPSYYLPPADIDTSLLEPAGRGSICEWKGAARYWTVAVGDRRAERVGWSYPDPTVDFRAIRDHLAFYAGPMDRCTVAGEVVTPQPGGFYGGWITSRIKGPFKGGPGTMGW
ncbi:MAG: DUF427 domain-containing protein [Gemmatimonadetes bacterium]|nr:DUF427 domain-containing protein [Gemmatimonadota bacterium]MBT8403526.1 DUF427 domain-containing protein [Gemmatimonadota bacterium]